MSANNKRSAQWVEGEGSSRSASKNKAAKSVKKFKLDGNAWYNWWAAERKKAGKTQSIKQHAEDEKEYKATKKPSLKQHPKAYKTLDDDDLSDVEFDGLDYEDAHVAFDPEKSPKLD